MNDPFEVRLETYVCGADVHEEYDYDYGDRVFRGYRCRGLLFLPWPVFGSLFTWHINGMSIDLSFRCKRTLLRLLKSQAKETAAREEAKRRAAARVVVAKIMDGEEAPF